MPPKRSTRRTPRCVSCSLPRPGGDWDLHELCPACRSCSRQNPCLGCMAFSTEQWRELETWSQAHPQGSGKGSPSPRGGSKGKGPSRKKGTASLSSGTATLVEPSGSQATAGTSKEVTAPTPSPTETAHQAFQSGESTSGHRASTETTETERAPLPLEPTGSRQGTSLAPEQVPEPPSDDSGADSDRGYRRDRPREPVLGPDVSDQDPTWLSRLVGILGPMVAQEVAKQSKGPSPTPPAQVSTQPSNPVVPPMVVPTQSPARQAASHSIPPSDYLELCASDQFEEEDYYMEEEEEAAPETPVPSVSLEEESPRGTNIPQELIDRVAGIFISRLGYSAPLAPPVVSESRLRATNEATGDGGPSLLPVDSKCRERIEALATRSTWTAFPAAQEKLFRVQDSDWESLFRPPSISSETRDKVRAEQGLASGTFRTQERRTREEDWFRVDTAARAGLKFSSVFLLAAESLLRAHQQLPEDPNPISRSEVGSLLFLLGPLARLIYDQFARVTLKTVQVRRDNVLDAFDWPSPEARDRLLGLPVLGPDLFGGQFLTKLAEEVKRAQDAQLASFQTPPGPVPTTTPRPRSRRRRPRVARKNDGRGRARGRAGPADRGSARGTARGRGGQATRRGRGRGRGAPRGRAPFREPFRPGAYPP